MKKLIIITLLFSALISCGKSSKSQTSEKENQVENQINKRFFAESSFWNTPIPENPEIDPNSDKWIAMLETEPTKNGFVINNEKWTIPVYEVNDSTPRYKVGLHYLSDQEKKNWKTTRETFGHGKDFDADLVPIPDSATPDMENDAHMALVDYKNRIAWDMWGMKKNDDGTWLSKTGMKYSLDGDGTFTNIDFDFVDGESIHFYGPSRAAGVPVLAGLIMYDEVKSGEIKHKLAACSRFSALREFTYPAIWTDGGHVGGIPQGATLQLDPKLDLSQFNLLPGELAVAKAAQKYGIVIVDIGGGQALYGEGLWGHKDKSWNGLLRFEGGISKIPYKHFRVLKVGEVTKKGDSKKIGWNMLKLDSILVATKEEIRKID